ncbi:S41 family peptidase [Massilia sp. SM-13]|uniref:S41 family peptidase n=1 Tax=Pseudoduganella rhizocola TaxID=3382643 RepID=UPI0038B54A9E
MKRLSAALALALSLAACGGDNPAPPPGGDGPPVGSPPPVDPPPANPPPVDPPPVDPPPVEPEFPDQLSAVLYYQNRCVKPEGSQRSGTLKDEFNFLRRWTDLTYLWNKEVPDIDASKYSSAVGYFNVLKTPLLTASGRPKDRFHFSYPNQTWEELSRGVEMGYGITWVRNADGTVPRTWRIAQLQPDAPAALAGLRRGDQLVLADGVDFINSTDSASIGKLNAAIYPKNADEPHRFEFRRGQETVKVALNSVPAVIAPVQNVAVIDTADGRFGYLTFGNHNALAEKPLVDAFTRFRDEGVTELVLDLRYNGGGLLSLASQVAYMIAGPEPTKGKVFERTLTNDPAKPGAPLLFTPTAGSGKALPYLGLKRVNILTGPGTCSASESIINGLRGVDVEVRLYGSQTCGKPYAFVPTRNCENTYFTIQYQGVNDKGFGDYGDGFAPSCRVADDLEHPLGSENEAVLAAALAGPARCVPAAGARAAAPAPGLVPVRPIGSEIAIHDRP